MHVEYNGSFKVLNDFDKFDATLKLKTHLCTALENVEDFDLLLFLTYYQRHLGAVEVRDKA